MAETKRKTSRPTYTVNVRSITSNTNPRDALGKDLSRKGWTVFTGDKALWPLATSSDPAKRAEFVKLIQDHDPDFAGWAGTFLTQGQLEPIEVREGGRGTFTLVFGARRCLAILFNWCLLGKPKEPVAEAYLVKGDTHKLLQRALVENFRKQQSPIEEARTIQALVNNGESKDDVAASLGYSLGTIKNRLALLDLAPKARKEVESGEKSPTEAIAEANGHAPKPKMRSRKEVMAAAEEFIEGTPQRAVLDWLLCRTEKIR